MDYKENVNLYGAVAAAKIAASSDVLTLINFVKFGNKADAQSVYEDLGEILGVGDEASKPVETNTVKPVEPASATSAATTSAATTSATTPPSTTANTNATNAAPDGIIVTK